MKAMKAEFSLYKRTPDFLYSFTKTFVFLLLSLSQKTGYRMIHTCRFQILFLPLL